MRDGYDDDDDDSDCICMLSVCGCYMCNVLAPKLPFLTNQPEAKNEEQRKELISCKFSHFDMKSGTAGGEKVRGMYCWAAGCQRC